MKQVFNYNKFNNEVQDTIVETFVSLADKFIEGKSNTQEYQEANATLNETFMKECVEANPNMKFSGIEMLKNPMVYGDMFFLHRFNTILAQAITPVVPTVISRGYDNLYDVTQVGWGDNAKYTVESNELFIVSDLAEGINRGGLQTAYSSEYTVQAHPKQVAAYVDWYHVAAGKQDWGRMVIKVGMAYSYYIQGRIAKAMASAIDNANTHAIGGYIVNGLTDENWLVTARNVELANGGAQVYALGTKLALAEVLPEDAKNQFRYGEDSAIVRTGYLPVYKEIPLVELGQALLPNTINGTPEVILPDDIIYMINCSVILHTQRVSMYRNMHIAIII